jgi:hypothetical protein
VLIVPNRRTVLENQVVVCTIKSRGGTSRHVKLQFDEINLVEKPLLGANGGGFTGATCTLLTTSDFTYVCTPTGASFTVSVRVRSSGSLSSALELTALLGDDAGTDCAIDSKSVQINGANNNGCGITESGSTCYDAEAHCFTATCPSTRKRSTVTASVFPMTFRIDYRRVKSHDSHLRNSHETSCGPRFEFLVDSQTQFLSSEQRFLSQGTLTFAGNATIVAGQQVFVEFRVVAVQCEHSKLLVWNQHALVSPDEIDEVELERDSFLAQKFANVDFK